MIAWAEDLTEAERLAEMLARTDGQWVFPVAIYRILQDPQ